MKKHANHNLPLLVENTTTKPEEVLRCVGYEHLSPEQAALVAVSLKLFSEILIEVYMLTGKPTNL